MATNFNDLRAEIKAQIKPNGVGAITGQVLQDAMIGLVECTEVELENYGTEVDGKVAQLSQDLQTIIDNGLTFVVKPHIDKVVMTETTATLEPDKFYLFGEVSALNITLAPVEEGYASQYIFQFTSPLESPTTLTMPVTIIWSDIPTIKGGMTYQVSVVEGLAMITGWTTAIEEE